MFECAVRGGQGGSRLGDDGGGGDAAGWCVCGGTAG